jgi:Tfp pilus assembly ATPase PilU
VIERSRDQYGMQSFDQELSRLYKAGVIDLDVAKSAATNVADFERALNFGDEAFDPNESEDGKDDAGDAEKEEALELSFEVD